MTSPLMMRRRAMGKSGPVVLVSDNFNRADSSTLGTTSSGHAWSEHAAYAIIANQAGVESASDGAFAIVVTGATDVEVSAVIPVLSSFAGLFARSAGESNFYLAQIHGNGTVDLYKRVAGTYTLLGSVSAAITAGDTLALRCSGSSIQAKVNGVSVVSVTDTSLTAGTWAGLRNGGAGTTNRWDDFQVTAA